MAASTLPSTHHYITGTKPDQCGMCGRRPNAHPEISDRYPTRHGGENGRGTTSRPLVNSTT